MGTIISLLLTVLLGIFLIYIYRRSNTLVYYSKGRWWLTWFSIAIITLMDEFTSVFYAPGEAFRTIGLNTILYIALTSILMRFLSTRMVEIAEILERNKIKGGGVYSFSYLVLGPTVSFVAVASILLSYILTAAISSVSAVENGFSLLPFFLGGKMFFVLGIIWFIAYLNILGIKDNAKFTYHIFVIAILVIFNLIFFSFYKSDSNTWMTMWSSIKDSAYQYRGTSIFSSFGILIFSVSSCILAYSGIESVIQTAGYVRNWREISKAYIFLALTVGIITPLISAFALSSKIDISAHETDLITAYAASLNGVPFGLLVGILASIVLIMAVNTAFVASSELLERVAERYGLTWLKKTNSRQSLYRIHILNAIVYSLIIIFTKGSQSVLAGMYALGLVASFNINMLSLIIYRYFHGTKEIPQYHTSRFGTVLLFLVLFSCFVWLAIYKVAATLLWLGITVFFVIFGLIVAKKRAPEIVEIQKTDSLMDLILYISELETSNVNIYFVRQHERYSDKQERNDVLIGFYSPREGIPSKIGDNHFRFQIFGHSLINNIIALLDVLNYELEDKQITVHFGWPMSSWWDRFFIGVMVFNLTRLPKMFPKFNFQLNYISVK